MARADVPGAAAGAGAAMPRVVGRGAAKYTAVAALSARESLAYLGQVVLRGAFLVVIMYAFVALWRTTFRVTGQAAIDGLTVADVIWYLVVTEAVVFAAGRVEQETSQDVKTGALAVTMNRPIAYPLYQWSRHLGRSAVALATNLVLAGAVAWVAVGPPPGGAAGVAGGFLLAVAALALFFWNLVGIGLLAFWAEDVEGFYLLYGRVLWLGGGLLLPFELLPPAVRAVVEWFVAPSWAGLWDVLAGQALWLGVFAGVAGLLYRAGVRRLSVHGG